MLHSSMERKTVIDKVPSLETRWTELIDYVRDGYEFKGAN